MEIPSEIFNLSKMGLSNLQNEPQRLERESLKINGELESLVMDNYRIFVENLTCSVQLRAEDRNLEDIRGDLKLELRNLSETCKNFRENVVNLVNFHKRNRKTLQHHMQLVELLEVPQLVDACARNGFYDEALELANFVNGLERRHLLAAEVRSSENSRVTKTRSGNNVVQSIVDDSFKILSALRFQLLQLLTDDSSLPQELQILGTLRKLDTLLIDRQLSLERFKNEKLSHLTDDERDVLRRHILRCAETRLQMDFLETRTVWLKKLSERSVNGIQLPSVSQSHYEPNSDSKVNSLNGSSLGPYGKAIEMLEVNRTAWFSIITQFNALFADTIDTIHPKSNILGIWVTKQVDKLLQQLQLFLPQIDDGSSMRSILEQTLFFSSRMKEIGCDFSMLIIPLFTKTISAHILNEWNAAIAQFKTIITNEKILIDSDEYSREQVVPLFLKQDELNDDIAVSSSKHKSYDEITPPSSLLSFPPLAYLLNAFLNGLNYLRECPLTTIRVILVSELRKVFSEVSDFLISSSKLLSNKTAKYITPSSVKPISGAASGLNNRSATSVSKSLESRELTLDKRYVTALMQDLLPHFLMCFDSVYQSSLQHGFTGSSKSLDNQTISVVKVKKGHELRDIVSKDLYLLFQQCWEKFSKENLLPIESRPTLTTAPTATVIASVNTIVPPMVIVANEENNTSQSIADKDVEAVDAAESTSTDINNKLVIAEFSSNADDSK